MAFCVNCGKPLTEGQRFCPGCGTAVAQAAGGQTGAAPTSMPPPAAPPAAAPPSYAPPAPTYAAPTVTYAAPAAPPPPPPTYAAYPPPGQPPYGAPPGYPAPQPRGRKGLWISLAACVLVVAVACVLVFVVFWGDITGGGGAASAPEKTVSKLLKAMESKDVDAMFSLMEEKALTDALGGITVDAAKAMLKSVMFDYQSVKFSGIKLETENTSATTATVTITEGTVTIKDNDGTESSEDVTEATEPVNFDLMKINGKWYLDPNSLSGLGGGLDGTDGTDGSDGTDAAGSTDSTDSTDSTSSNSTDTTMGDTSVTLTGDTTVTTGTTAGITANGSATPEDAVYAFFDAMEAKDMAGVLKLMDPVTIEESLGMSVEDAETLMQGELFDYESVTLTGLKLSKESTGDTTATVTVTEGLATVTDSDGQTTTEDVKDAGEPLAFQLIQRDGLWYLDPAGLF